jgi:hypothetical protein
VLANCRTTNVRFWHIGDIDAGIVQCPLHAKKQTRGFHHGFRLSFPPR